MASPQPFAVSRGRRVSPSGPGDEVGGWGEQPPLGEQDTGAGVARAWAGVGKATRVHAGYPAGWAWCGLWKDQGLPFSIFPYDGGTGTRPARHGQQLGQRPRNRGPQNGYTLLDQTIGENPRRKP
eukprot:gene11130-biopygen6347